jgi:hypothetical protein
MLTTMAFFMGGVVGYVVADSKSKSGYSEESKRALLALMQDPHLMIQENLLQCDLPGKGVSHFIASYILWSQSRSPSGSSSFSCEGGVLKACTWSYGEARPFEAWSRVLRFEYVSSKNAITPGSLACIDVP